MTEASSSGGAEVHVVLFVAGGAPRSAAALRNLSAAIATLRPPAAAMQVDIIDVLLDPAKALEVGLLATPGLSLTLPDGKRRWFIGNLGQPDVLANWIVDNLGDQTGSRAPQPNEA